MPKKVDMRAFLIDKQEHIEQAARAMKAMSHPLRLKILCVLADQEVSVQDIVERRHHASNIPSTSRFCATGRAAHRKSPTASITASAIHARWCCWA